MVNLIRMKLVNFIGVYLGTQLTEFEIDRSKSKNNIILIIGNNGSGKSSIIAEMTPIPLEHVGSRNKSRIIPGEIGIKELDYIVDDYVLYKIKIIYDPKKGTKCFITKTIDDKEIDLNPNGNVESYLEVIEHELHMNKNYTSVGFLSGSGKSKNFVAMLPTERNTYISEWMPEISEFLDAYKISSKILSKLKKDIDNYNKQIGNMSSINYELELNYVNANIENLNNSLGEVNSKIVQLETYQEQIFKNARDYKELNDQKVKFLEFSKKMKTRYDNLIKKYEYLSSIDFSKDFKVVITELESKIDKTYTLLNNVEENINLLSSEISSNETFLSSDEKITSSDLTNININIVQTSKLLETVTESIKGYADNFPSISDDDLLTFINNLSKISSFLSTLESKFQYLNNFVSLDTIKNMGNINNFIEEKVKELSSVEELLKDKQSKLTFINNEIYKYEHGNIDTQILMKRPEFCINHSCGIVEELLKYLNPQDNVKTLYEESKKIQKEVLDYQTTVEEMKESIKQYNNGISIYESIRSYLYNNNELISTLPEVLSVILLKEPSDIYIQMNEIKMLVSELTEYSSVVRKRNDLSKSIEDLNNLRKMVTTNNQIQEKLDELNEKYDNLISKRNELREIISRDTKSLETYKNIDSVIEEKEYETEIYNTDIEKMNSFKNSLLILNKCTYIYNSNKNYIENVLKRKKIELETELMKMNNKRDEMTTFSISKKQIEKMREELQTQFNRVNILNKIWSPKVGYPSWKIERFLNDLTIKTNEDMESMWGSSIKIKGFNIDATDFSIVVEKDGVEIKDASLCSAGETSVINTAISFSIIESNVENGGYDVLRCDEVDGCLDESRRFGFVDMIQNRVNQMGVNSCFIITHNNNFDYLPCDLILLKGAKISDEQRQNKNILFEYTGGV